MAASQPALKLKEIDEELHCSICLERYTNPRTLPCSHTFCHDCLDEHITHTTNDAQFPCPNCRLSTPTPPNGVTGFQRNFLVNNLVEIISAQENKEKPCSVCDDGTKAVHMCIDCHEYLCQTHADYHRKSKISKSHLVVSMEDIHAGKFENEIRARQVMPCAKHPEEKVRYYCIECKTLVCIDCVNTGDCPHSSQRQNITNAGEQTKKQLQECLSKLQVQIQEKASRMTDAQQANKETEESLLTVEKEIDEHCKLLCRTIIATKDKYIASIRQQLLEKSQPYIDIQTNINNDLKRLKQAEQQAMMVYNYGNAGEMLMSYHAIIQQQETLEAEIHYTEVPSAFTTSFMPNQSFAEVLKTPDHVFGEVHHTAQLLNEFSIKLPDDTEEPQIFGVAVHNHGDITVADHTNKKLKTFSTNGQLKDVFTGDQKYKIGIPTGLKCLPSGDMLMVDFKQKTVVILSPERKVKKVHSVGRTVVAVAMNNVGQLVMSDQEEVPSLTVWDPETSSVVMKVNKNERGENLFEKPYHVTVNSKGYMIVTDSDATKNSLFIFDQTGDILCDYSHTADKTKLNYPTGVCVDDHDNIYVADCNNHRIIQLTPNGQFSRVVVSDEDGLRAPYALTWDNQRNLVVTEQLSGKVKVFQFRM